MLAGALNIFVKLKMVKKSENSQKFKMGYSRLAELRPKTELPFVVFKKNYTFQNIVFFSYSVDEKHLVLDFINS